MRRMDPGYDQGVNGTMSSPVFEGHPAFCPRVAPLLGAAAAAVMGRSRRRARFLPAPAAPAVSGYADHPLTATEAAPGVPGGAAQTFTTGADISGDWWTLFHSKPLTELIDQALANNHDLKAAQAALTVAQENTRTQRGAFYPQLNAGFAGSRQRQSGDLAPTPNNNTFEYNLFTPQVNVAYNLDVFGLTRRTVENARAQEDAARAIPLGRRPPDAHLQCRSGRLPGRGHRRPDRRYGLGEPIDIDQKVVETPKYQQQKGATPPASTSLPSSPPSNSGHRHPAATARASRRSSATRSAGPRRPLSGPGHAVAEVRPGEPDRSPPTCRSSLPVRARRTAARRAAGSGQYAAANAAVGIAAANRLLRHPARTW